MFAPETDVSFSIHSYDCDGDAYEYGIYLHIGNTRILVANANKESIKEFFDKMRSIEAELLNEID